MSRDRRRAYRFGHAAEGIAALSLMLKGWRILERRCKTPLGEIDLIARRGNVIAFIEVKARASLDEAAQSISPRQQARLQRALRWWLAAHPAAVSCELRMDAMLVAPWHWPRHLPGAICSDTTV